MTVEIKATIPTSDPTRRMLQPLIPMSQLSNSVMSSQEEDLPQEIHSTAMVVFFSCILKKLRKRQTSCWVCFLLIQYLQECCLILVRRIHFSPKNFPTLVKFNQPN